MKSLNTFKLITITLGVILGLALSSCGTDWPDLPLVDREIYPPDGESSSMIDTTNVVHFGEIDFTEYNELPPGSFPFKNKYFTSVNISPEVYLGEWVSKNFNEVTAGSTITLNFDYLFLPDSLKYLRQSLARFSSKNYELKWGKINPSVYTPSTDIYTEVTKVLETDYGQIQPENPYRVVEYNYSNEEPTYEYDKYYTVYKEYFDDIAANYRDNYWNKWLDEKHKPKGAIFKAVDGNINIFQPYTRGTVNGVFVRSRNNTGDTWFITPPVDLSSAKDPILYFRIGFGYSAGIENFKLMISTDFDGNENNILNATWKNHRGEEHFVGSSHTISDITHSSSYATESSMRNIQLDLSQYTSHEKVYIGFRENPGDNPTNPAGLPFTVIDRISVASKADFASVPASSITPKIELFEKTAETWKKLTKGYYILDKSDYDSLGSSYLDENEAIDLIPTVLANRVTSANENDIYCVIYKSSNSAVSNFNFKLEEGNWKVIGLDPERASISFELEYPYTWKKINK